MSRNIVVLSGNYPPESGGPSKFAQNFSIWASSKFEKAFVVSTHPDKNKRFLEGKVEVNLVSRKHNLAVRYLLTVLLIRKLAKKNTLVIANGLFYEVLIASIIFRLKYCVKIPGDIVWEKARAKRDTNLDMYQFQNSKLAFKYALLRFFFTLAIRRASRVVVPSNNLNQICLGWGINPARIVVIFNSVDVEKYSPRKNALKSFDIITVSRLIGIKQIPDVINVASELNLSLLIVGSGPEEERLKDLNRSLGSPAKFFGNATQEQLPDLYRSARFFILNSEFEAGTPYSLLEARACGLVCIANERTGADDVIKHNVDGFLCRPTNRSDLMINLKRAINLNEGYFTFSEKAREATVASFSENSVYRALVLKCEHS